MSGVVEPVVAVGAQRSQGHQRRLRVAHVIETLGFGGAERLIATTVKHLDRSRFESMVVTLAPPAHLLPDVVNAGVAVQELGAARPRDAWRRFGALVRVLREWRPDVVHTHLRFANLYGRLAARAAGVGAVVTSAHCPDYTLWPARRLDARLFKSLDRLTARYLNAAFVAVSRAVADDYRAHLGLRDVEVVYDFLDLDAFAPLGIEDRRAQRARYGWRPDDVVILAVGRLAPEKGRRHAVAAMRGIREVVPQARLVLVGDGPEEGLCREIVARLGLDAAVTFAGARTDVPQMLACADLFLSPSEMEGFCIAIVEAMAAGVPVIATAAGGVTEVIEDGVTGVLVPPRDPAAISEAVVALLRDPERRTRFAQRARLAAIERFSAGAGVSRLAALYERIAPMTEVVERSVR